MTPRFTVADIRQTFLDFFKDRGHTVVASSPLVPANDPTLMFTNSGMVQFKDVFLGTDKRPYVRAASVQACLRAGGKHNDLENVGYTARHHTFFEMLGNWSFGDYFKRDSLKWGWELLTKVYGLPAERLWATVYIDDDEAYDIWTKEIGLPTERVVRIGDNKGAKYASDNFWMMADTGPCGPCSEIFYDHGPGIPGGPPGSPDADGDRYIEIWNHVFMQFDMQPDGSIRKLPAPCVDTGMGLERLAAILQHVHSNYEIDLFAALIKAAARETHTQDLANPSLKVIADHIRATSFLVADGVIPSNEGRGYVQRRIIRRAIRHGYKLGCKTPFFHKLVPDLVALMGDAYPRLKAEEKRITEVLKAEEERFYETLELGMQILDQSLGEQGVVLAELIKEFSAKEWSTDVRGQASGDARTFVFDAILTTSQNERVAVEFKSRGFNIESPEGKREIEAFAKAIIPSEIDRGIFVVFGGLPTNVGQVDHRVLSASKRLDLRMYSEARLEETRRKYGQVLPGRIAFLLHDTYGFPLDLTNDVCRERGVTVDEAGFNAAMDKQKAQARAGGKFKMDRALEYGGAGNRFTGYEHVEEAAKVLALYVDGTPAQQLKAGQSGVVVLDTTPFYAESGGQVGDQGVLMAAGATFEVVDTQKIKADVFGHHGTLAQGTLKVGDAVKAQVNTALRAATMRNHSATHLMHKALREVLGEHVQQKGSLVDAEKTRFDFAHNAPLTDAQIREIERRVNAEILVNSDTQARLMDIESAQKTGAMMLFGEKYGDTVRVLDIGTSRELCGGTHVRRTGDIGLFKIVGESGVAAGVRRVEAITGLNALRYMQGLASEIQSLGQALGTANFYLGFQEAATEEAEEQQSELQKRLAAMQGELRLKDREISQLKGKLASSRGDELVSQAVDVKGIKVLAARLDGADAKTLRDTMDKLKDKLKTAAIVLAAVEGGKVQIAAGVTADSIGKLKAGELVNFVAQQVGGKGGGKPDMAMAGGTDASKLPQALAAVQGWVAERA